MDTISILGPQYPLTAAHTRVFITREAAFEHYLKYQYVRCMIYDLAEGRALMVVHA